MLHVIRNTKYAKKIQYRNSCNHATLQEIAGIFRKLQELQESGTPESYLHRVGRAPIASLPGLWFRSAHNEAPFLLPEESYRPCPSGSVDGSSAGSPVHFLNPFLRGPPSLSSAPWRPVPLPNLHRSRAPRPHTHRREFRSKFVNLKDAAAVAITHSHRGCPKLHNMIIAGVCVLLIYVTRPKVAMLHIAPISLLHLAHAPELNCGAHNNTHVRQVTSHMSQRPSSLRLASVR